MEHDTKFEFLDKPLTGVSAKALTSWVMELAKTALKADALDKGVMILCPPCDKGMPFPCLIKDLHAPHLIVEDLGQLIILAESETASVIEKAIKALFAFYTTTMIYRLSGDKFIVRLFGDLYLVPAVFQGWGLRESYVEHDPAIIPGMAPVTESEIGHLGIPSIYRYLYQKFGI